MIMSVKLLLLAAILSLMIARNIATAFCPPVSFAGGTSTSAFKILPQQAEGNSVFWKNAKIPPAHSRLRPTTRTRSSSRSSSRQLVRLQGGLFGLGFAELGIIGIALFFVLGPQTIGKLVRASGERAADMAEELKRVPDEFAQGLDEGEATARARKARPIRGRVVVAVVEEDKDKEE
jgi:Sec-independent protein translocase protein TatA